MANDYAINLDDDSRVFGRQRALAMKTQRHPHVQTTSQEQQGGLSENKREGLFHNTAEHLIFSTRASDE